MEEKVIFSKYDYNLFTKERELVIELIYKIFKDNIIQAKQIIDKYCPKKDEDGTSYSIKYVYDEIAHLYEFNKNHVALVAKILLIEGFSSEYEKYLLLQDMVEDEEKEKKELERRKDILRKEQEEIRINLKKCSYLLDTDKEKLDKISLKLPSLAERDFETYDDVNYLLSVIDRLTRKEEEPKKKGLLERLLS